MTFAEFPNQPKYTSDPISAEKQCQITTGICIFTFLVKLYVCFEWRPLIPLKNDARATRAKSLFIYLFETLTVGKIELAQKLRNTNTTLVAIVTLTIVTLTIVTLVTA